MRLFSEIQLQLLSEKGWLDKMKVSRFQTPVPEKPSKKEKDKPAPDNNKKQEPVKEKK